MADWPSSLVFPGVADGADDAGKAKPWFLRDAMSVKRSSDESSELATSMRVN